MNKENIVLLIFILFTSYGFSQIEDQKTVLNRAIFKKSEQYSGLIHFKNTRSFFLNKQWDSTLVYTSKLLLEEEIDNDIKNYCHFFRAKSFKSKQLYTEAKEEFNKVSKDFYFMNYILMDLGSIAFEELNYKKALAYYRKIDSIQNPDIFGIQKFSVYHNMGLSNMFLEEYEKAELYLKQDLNYRESKKDSLPLFNCYNSMASLYYEQYRDIEAISYFKKAYNLSKHLKDFNFKSIGALNMAVVEENRNDFKKALVYRKEYEQWKDSLNNQNKIYETAQLEKKIAVAQKQEEVNVLEAENKTKAVQRNGSIISAGILLLLLGITFFFYREKIKRNAIISEQKERLNELNTTKDKLFSIVSHDLRSSVNAIKSSNKNVLYHLETANTALVKETLQQNSAIVNGAYRLLDNLLNWALLQTKQSYFKINDLQLFKTVTHVAYNYIPLMNEKKISFENQIDKKHVVEADQESLKIMIRNLLDNAIKFSKSGDRIKVYSKEQGAYYDLIVEDSGMGMDEDTKEELLKHTQLLSKKKHEDSIGTGLGLHLVKSMIIKNQGEFNIKSELGNGTKIILSLPKKKS